jgi:hypothetical protein
MAAVSMTAFRHSGKLITVVSTVFKNLLLVLLLLILYMLFYAEIVENFFNDYAGLGNLSESFFTLVEALFGSIKFADEKDVEHLSTFYGANANLLLYTFTSNILATFLLIAYLSSIYDMV